MPDQFKDDDERWKLSEAEAAAVEKLRCALAARFGDIVDLVAATLGFDPARLSPDQRAQAETEAEEAVDRWGEGPETAIETPKPSTSLQHLLRAYYDTEGQILNIQDEAMGRDRDEG